MDEINSIVKDLENLPDTNSKTNLKKRISLIKNFKGLKEKEEKRLHTLLDNNFEVTRKTNSYNNLPVDELLDIFNKSQLEDKVLIIDSIQENINNLCKELFFKKESTTLDASSSYSSSESD